MYHVFSEEAEALQRAHSLCRSIEIPKHNVCLPPHLHGLQGYHVKYDAIGCKKHVKISFQVLFGELVGEVSDVETVYVRSAYLRIMLAWEP
jgi:hypothetical protein